MRSASGLVLIVASVALLGCDEIRREEYSSLAEAREAGLFSRGWLPDVLPLGAGPISHVHDIDTNSHCSRSRISSDSAAVVRQRLDLLGYLPSASRPEPPDLGCPFTAEGVPESGVLRGDAVAGSTRFAAVSDSGVLLIWSERPPALAR